MKNPLVIVNILICFFVFISCKKDNTGSTTADKDYIVFGHFYGFCHGEQCIEIFKISAGKLYEDILDHYPGTENPYDGSYVLLTDEKYQLVKDMVNNIPNTLYQVNNHVIGTPDAGDWGGLYLEVTVNGQRRFWLFDKMKQNLPEDLRPLADEIERCISLVQ